MRRKLPLNRASIRHSEAVAFECLVYGNHKISRNHVFQHDTIRPGGQQGVDDSRVIVYAQCDDLRRRRRFPEPPDQASKIPIRYSEVHDDHRRLQTIGPFNQRAGVGHREDRVERRLQQTAHALQVTSVPVCE